MSSSKTNPDSIDLNEKCQSGGRKVKNQLKISPPTSDDLKIAIKALRFYKKNCPQSSLDGEEGQPTAYPAINALNAIRIGLPEGLFDEENPGNVEWTFRRGDRVTKIKGSCWTGRVVGFYCGSLTPVGYVVESETEKGSCQIYPQSALKLHPLPEHTVV